jgi:hypothetical protein
MTKSVRQKTTVNEQAPVVLPSSEVKPAEEKTEMAVPFASATESLMPELEELVKKNPNRLIGCGG